MLDSNKEFHVFPEKFRGKPAFVSTDAKAMMDKKTSARQARLRPEYSGLWRGKPAFVKTSAWQARLRPEYSGLWRGKPAFVKTSAWQEMGQGLIMFLYPRK